MLGDLERRWAREVREHFLRLHHEGGPVADLRDLPKVILRLAVDLLGAEKGLLLSARGRERGESLELVAVEGFSHDPAESAVARRFAVEVFERDRAVREDDWRALAGEQASPADEEIVNLVAIPLFVRDEFSGVVVCANKPGGFHEYDDEVLLSIGDHAGAVLETGRLHGELRDSYLATVKVLAETIEAREPHLRQHSEEVARTVAAVATRLRLDPQRREQLLFACLLHDVGKIGIRDGILLKQGSLTPDEFEQMQLHTRIGAEILEQVPALRPMVPAILHHHEHFDGTGYPSRLRGDEIPLEARILSVADAFSAMTEERPYSTAMSREQACAELERCAGSQFDPEVVRLFIEELDSPGTRG